MRAKWYCNRWFLRTPQKENIEVGVGCLVLLGKTNSSHLGPTKQPSDVIEQGPDLALAA